MSKFSIEFYIGLAVAIALFILDKSGKSSAPLNVVLLIIISVLLIHPALQLTWIWSSPDVAIRMWRLAFVICCTVLAVAYFGIWTWPTARETTAAPESRATATPPSPKSETVAEQPYIYAKLTIEPADKGSARLRLEIENSKVPIENVRYTKKGLGYAHFEYVPSIARMMAPGAKLSQLISPIPLKPNEYGSLLVNIYFDAKLDGVTKHFIASHRFLLQKEDIKPQTLDPESSSYTEGVLESPQQTGEVTNQFAQPEGTVSFVLQEKNKDGNWNLVSMGSDQRRFMFNPETKTVSFSTKTQSGRIVSISELVMVKDNAKHLIIFAWSPYGGSLHVDGRGREDFDDGHNPDQTITKLPSPTPDKGASPPPPTS